MSSKIFFRKKILLGSKHLNVLYAVYHCILYLKFIHKHYFILFIVYYQYNNNNNNNNITNSKPFTRKLINHMSYYKMFLHIRRFS